MNQARGALEPSAVELRFSLVDAFVAAMSGLTALVLVVANSQSAVRVLVADIPVRALFAATPTIRVGLRAIEHLVAATRLGFRNELVVRQRAAYEECDRSEEETGISGPFHVREA